MFSNKPPVPGYVVACPRSQHLW